MATFHNNNLAKKIPSHYRILGIAWGWGGTNKKTKNDCFKEKIMHLNASSPENLRPVKLWFPLVSVWVGLRLNKAQGS